MAAHILIIEDNDMSFVLADHLLRRAGYSTRRASDGESGMRAALENTSALVLCDLDLPGMDGYEVAAALRGNANWREVPLLAFTADTPGITDRARAAGFSGSLFKPVDPQTFATTLAHFLAAVIHAS